MNGQPIGAVVTWLSGVLLPGITHELGRALGMDGKWFNWLALPGASSLVERWQTGQISDADFWSALVEQSGLPVEAGAVRQRLTSRMHPDPDVLAVLEELPTGVQRWLLSDLPPAVLPVGLAQAVDSFCTIDLPDAGLNRLTPDVFNLVAEKAQMPLRECLFIDGNHKRAVQTVRYGGSVGLFVSPWRLRREFILRRILAIPMPSHIPGHSR